MFAVIEFSPEQGGGLSLVNKKWLTPRKKEVFWPPYKEQSQFSRSVRKSEAINTETWRLYNVNRIFYETDDYDKAVEKLKRAEETSDLQTELDEEDNFNIRKRKRIVPSRYINSDSDSSDDNRHLPAPPTIKRALFKGPVPSSDGRLINTSSGISPHVSCTASQLANKDEDSLRLTEKDLGSRNAAIALTEKSAIQVLLENVLEIKNQNKIILSTVSKLVEAEKPKTSIESVPVKFPIKNLSDLDILEDFLHEQDHSNLLTTYYSGLGGNNINSKTNRVLKETLDDSLAISFNFYGRNNKKPFSRLKLSSCIINAVKSTCGCTSAQVEGAIKIWLKHAAQRVKVKSTGKNIDPRGGTNNSA